MRLKEGETWAVGLCAREGSARNARQAETPAPAKAGVAIVSGRGDVPSMGAPFVIMSLLNRSDTGSRRFGSGPGVGTAPSDSGNRPSVRAVRQHKPKDRARTISARFTQVTREASVS